MRACVANACVRAWLMRACVAFFSLRFSDARRFYVAFLRCVAFFHYVFCDARRFYVAFLRCAAFLHYVFTLRGVFTLRFCTAF